MVSPPTLSFPTQPEFFVSLSFVTHGTSPRPTVCLLPPHFWQPLPHPMWATTEVKPSTSGSLAFDPGTSSTTHHGMVRTNVSISSAKLPRSVAPSSSDLYIHQSPYNSCIPSAQGSSSTLHSTLPFGLQPSAPSSGAVALVRLQFLLLPHSTPFYTAPEGLSASSHQSHRVLHPFLFTFHGLRPPVVMVLRLF